MDGITKPVVVVGVDGSAECLVATRWAADEAARRHLTLRLLHAYSVPVVGVPTFGIPPDFTENLRKAGRAALDEAAHEVKRTHPDLEIAQELVNADPRPALASASAEAALTVVGTRGGGRIPEVLLGSVALHIAAHGRSPVVVVPPATVLASGADSPGVVLLGVDGSRTSESAVAFAFDEASRRGARLDAVLVWDDLAIRGFVRGEPLIGPLEDDEEHVVLSEQLAGWRDKYPDVIVRQLVLRGQPAAALLRHGAELERGPELVVVGSRGRGGLTGLLLGSTSQRLICHSSWPVVVVRDVRR
jgi:nucleotide-binding universal stress UspA family protein